MSGAGRRVLPEAVLVRRSGKRIGLAIILLPLLACRGLLPPDPTLARRTRRALGILSLLAGSALIQPVSAEAQSVSVSNLSESAGADATIASQRQHANAFTTGGVSSDRYQLNSVILHVANSGIRQIDVSIHAASGSDPGSKIGSNLTGTISSTAGDTTYTASGITLNGRTTYFMRVGGDPSATNRDLGTTQSDGQIVLPCGPSRIRAVLRPMPVLRGQVSPLDAPSASPSMRRSYLLP